MRFPLTETQAHILVKLINKEKLLKRDMMILDMVILTQVGAIKMRKEGLTITKAGKIRFVKWARKQGMVA
jgi:hypothetical protein|tara:strand:+ start:142 stop:351 length:210 start_codon:yes stop_codon:yes gene_type:complete